MVQDLVRLITVPVAVLAIACSSGSGSNAGDGGSSGTSDGGSPGTDGGGGSSSLQEFCSKAMLAMAQKQASCQGLPASVAAGLVQRMENAGLCSNWSKGVSASRVSFDATKAQACLTAIPNASCEALNNDLAGVSGCGDAIHGRVANGGNCYNDAECVAGSRCNTDSCPGKCVSYVASGGDCTASAECTPGTVCALGVCAAPKTSGDCVSMEECALGYRCSSEGQCVAKTKLGNACTVNTMGQTDCQDLTYCTGNSPKCTLYPTTGETCWTGTGEYNICLNSTCDQGTGKCVALLSIGATCTSMTQCASLNCDASGKCAPMPGDCPEP